jgi:hypothetical protein
MKIFLYTAFIVVLGGGILFPSFVDGSDYQNIRFYIDNQYKPGGDSIERAVHLTSSIRANFFVEEKYYNSLSEKNRSLFLDNVANLGVEFDSKIYLQEKIFFGDEWSPGIDNDHRITVYITEMDKNVDGYFRETDEYDVANSNKREMIYVNARYINQGRGSAILAHEFQHLINFNQKKRLRVVNEERWLNEALSEYAVTALGLNDIDDYLRRAVRDFLANPTDALGLWEASFIDKGSVSVFLHYLAGQYGDDVVKDIIQSKFAGENAINYALQKNGFKKIFSDIFIDWTIALFLNSKLPSSAVNGDTSDITQLYKFNHPDLQYLPLHIKPQLTYLADESGLNASFAVRDLAPMWHRFLPTKYDAANPLALRISFSSRNDYYFRVPVVVTYLSGEIDILETEINNGIGSIEIPGFNTGISSVVIIPASHTKLSDFHQADPLRVFSYSVSLKKSDSAKKKDESRYMVSAYGNPKVYVLGNGYRRHLQNPIFFNFYEHLKWENVEIVSAEELDKYKESKLVRRSGDYKVYEVVGFRQFRWLDMTPEEFEKSGRSWEAVYEVNQAEFNWYKEN